MDLQGKNLSKYYGHKCVFEALDFSLPANSLCVLKGENGSGKTTFLRCLAGATRFTGGSVVGLPERVSFLGHNSFLYSALSVRENFRLYSVDNIWAEKLKLNLDKKVSDLSAGQVKRASLAVCFSRDAGVYLLDEPFSSLDKTGREIVQLLIENVQASFFISTHFVDLKPSLTLTFGR